MSSSLPAERLRAALFLSHLIPRTELQPSAVVVARTGFRGIPHNSAPKLYKGYLSGNGVPKAWLPQGEEIGEDEPLMEADGGAAASGRPQKRRKTSSSGRHVFRDVRSDIGEEQSDKVEEEDGDGQSHTLE
eukprot:6329440-Amphidinium_carterae.1